MTASLLRRYDRQVPRYTSYPTAPHFHEGIAGETYGDWLAALTDADTLSLYLHVPFCAEMCWFCGCHTKVTRKYEPVARYVELLLKEAELVRDTIPANPHVTSIHWGGGSPTKLTPEDFGRLMGKLRRSYAIADYAEIAVEVDPRTLTGAFVQEMARARVNRASIGVQDFNEDVQQAINRIQPYGLIEGAIKDLRAAGIRGINFDLIYGLPHQSEAHIERNVELAVALAPDRLSVFGYAHVPWMKTHQKMIREEDLPGTEERFAQAELLGELLEQAGYRCIGLDHFAKPDDEMARALEGRLLRRNFQGYTVDEATALLGFGASAIGKMPQGYVQNHVPMKTYADVLSDNHLPTARGVALGQDDRMRGRIIEELMCTLSVDLDDYGGPWTWCEELVALEPLQADGLVRVEGSRITIPPRARPFLRLVAAAFDAYLKPAPARYSKAI